jgi:hypothetical protein
VEGRGEGQRRSGERRARHWRACGVEKSGTGAARAQESGQRRQRGHGREAEQEGLEVDEGGLVWNFPKM